MVLATLFITGSLAVLNFFAGAVKLITPWPQLQQKMPWTETTGKGQAYFAAWSEIVGAIGALVPLILAHTFVGWAWARWISLCAVIGLTVIQSLAIRLHIRRGETQNLGINLPLIALGIIAASLIIATS